MNRIIFVTDLTLWSMGKGQGGPAFHKTIESYVQNGWDVFIVSDVPSNKDYPLISSEHNIVIQPTIFKKLVLVRKLGSLFRLLDHFFTTKEYNKTIKRIIQGQTKATVLYAYEIYGVKSCYNMSKKYIIPFVTRFQGTILADIKDSKYNRLARYPHFQALSTPADLIIMTNDGTKGSEVLDRVHNMSKRLFLMNGLDLLDNDIQSMVSHFDRQIFRREKLNVFGDECVFLTVSRLVKWKRLDRTIDGFADYCKANPTGKLVIVGDGDAREELERRAKHLGIFERVQFTGSVLHEEVYNYMMACDVFLSLYDLSNVGNPLLEAMTLGKCIITYDVGDTREFITDQENGILLSTADLVNLGIIMEELSKNQGERRRLGETAAEYAKKHFWNWNDRMKYELSEVGKLLKL